MACMIGEHNPDLGTLINNYTPSYVVRKAIQTLDDTVRPIADCSNPLDKGYQKKILLPYLLKYSGMNFSPNCHGGIKGQSISKVISKAQNFISQDKKWVVRLDFERAFTNVSWQKLFEIMQSYQIPAYLINAMFKVQCTHVLEDDGTFSTPEKGLYQGLPISPFMMNIFLSFLDSWMDSSNWSYYRYVDDIVIFCSSEEEAKQIDKTLRFWIEDYYKIPINENKSEVCKIWEINDLHGYRFLKEAPHYLVLSERGIAKYKYRTSGFIWGWKHQIKKSSADKIKEYISSRRHDLELTQDKKQLQELDNWLSLEVLKTIAYVFPRFKERLNTLIYLTGNKSLSRKLATRRFRNYPHESNDKHYLKYLAKLRIKEPSTVFRGSKLTLLTEETVSLNST